MKFLSKNKGEIMADPKIIQFPNAAKIFGADRNVIAEIMTIRPSDATQWLRANRNNRPVRKRHVEFLASEILNGNWQVNGQAIVIAEDEQILDGQHRLFAIIEAGKPIKSMVVYGISPDAFKTIDTGAVRTGADALCLYFPDVQGYIVKAAATAAQWCYRLERQSIHSHGRSRMSNTDVIEYVSKHPSMFQCTETLAGYPHESRPLSLGCGTALYEMFQRKNVEKADLFMRRFYTGEEIIRSDAEYILRAAFIRDAEKVAKYPIGIRMRMVIKGWNWVRRTKPEPATRATVTVKPDDDQKIKIF
jgi:hypothetical protein